MKEDTKELTLSFYIVLKMSQDNLMQEQQRKCPVINPVSGLRSLMGPPKDKAQPLR